MAITDITVTKQEVTPQLPDLWNICINLTCLDGVEEVINQNFMARYRPGQDPELVVKALREEMQNLIDEYNQAQVYYNHTKLDDAVAWLNSVLVP